MWNAATVALSTPDVLRLVCGFQSGMYYDMRAFRKLPAACEFPRDAATVDAVLTPWLDKHGLDRLPVLLACVVKMHTPVVEYAIHFDRFDVLESLTEMGRRPCDASANLLVLAATQGHVAMCDHLVACGYAMRLTDAANAAALRGHVQVLALLAHESMTWVSKETLENAVWGDQVEVLVWLFDTWLSTLGILQRKKLTERALLRSVRYRSWGSTKWLAQHMQSTGERDGILRTYLQQQDPIAECLLTDFLDRSMAVPLDVLARASPSCGLDKLQRVFGHFDSLAKTGGGVQRRDASMQCMVHLVANPTTGPTLRWLVDTMDKVDIDDVLRHHGVQALRSVLLLTPHVQIHHVDMAQFLVDYGVVAVELMRAH
ncbi:hypothetical protein As57867_002992, partial [Aphanomyces stellatus]